MSVKMYTIFSYKLIIPYISSSFTHTGAANISQNMPASMIFVHAKNMEKSQYLGKRKSRAERIIYKAMWKL